VTANSLPLKKTVSHRSLAAGVEERLLVPAYSSRWAPASIAAHRGLALPLQIAGEARRRSVCLGNASVEILEIGREKLVGPIGTRLFGELPPPHRESRRAVWSPAELARLDADLVVAEVHRWMAPRFQRAGWLLIPGAVRWHGDLAAVPPAQPCQSLRDDLRKVRNNGFTIEHTSARGDWDEFYTMMVRPQALARHGESAWIPSSRLMRTFESAGVLHLVSLGGARVAGSCSIGHGELIWLPLTGVRQGDRSLLQKGAGVAAFALTLEWARSRGYRQLDFGRSSPFVNDGIQRFKRKWGLLPVPDPLAHVAAVLVRSHLVREAFSRDPVMVEDGQDLHIYAGQGP
jgi:GNAT acetyltransferase-like protein